MPKVHTNCEECGKEVIAFPSQHRRFCSGRCKAVAQHRTMVQFGEHGRGTRPRRGDEFACAMCKRTFYRAPAEIQDNRQYCSVRCTDASKVKGVSSKPCQRCGSQMRLKPSQAMRLFCSRKCYVENLIKRPAGREHNGRPVRLDPNGYVLVWEPSHPNKSQKGWQYEHRLVVEQAFGILLVSDQQVHHKNGIKDDNRIENLQVLSKVEHAVLSSHDYRNQIAKKLAALEEYERRFGPL